MTAGTRPASKARLIWCDCPVCEWRGLIDHGEVLCEECGNHLVSECWVDYCVTPACIFVSGQWTCIEDMPFLDPAKEHHEFWTVARFGNTEVIEVEGYTVRGVGDVRMAVLTLASGQRVSVPLDDLLVASERRTALPAGSYGHALWLDGEQITKNAPDYQNFAAQEQAPKDKQLPAVNWTRWDYVLGDERTPVLRAYTAKNEIRRWLIRASRPAH